MILNGIFCILKSILIIFTVQIPGDILHLTLIIINTRILNVSIVRIEVIVLFTTVLWRIVNIWSVSQRRRCYCACDWYRWMKVICIYILLPVLTKRSRIVNWLIALISRKRLAVILMRFGLLLVQPFCFVDIILNIYFLKLLFFFFFWT